VPIDDVARKKARLVEAVGRVLARVGFAAITPDAVAAEAQLPRAELFRHFQGLDRLVAAYARTGRFWPPAAELVGDDAETLKRMPPAELMAAFFKRTLRGLLGRPEALDILAWEGLSRSELCRPLDRMGEDPPADVDLTALVILVAGGIHFLTIRSRTSDCVGGVDLESEAGWRRIEAIIDLILARTLAPGPLPSRRDPL
jgi:AcrR family transcriptional regulator